MNSKEMAEAIGSLQGQVAEQAGQIAALQAQIEEVLNGGARKRGPKTERSMTEADAWMVKFGALKPPVTHKVAAETLGLSYGQVFSCRGSYTFKGVKIGDFRAEQFDQNHRFKEAPKS